MAKPDQLKRARSNLASARYRLKNAGKTPEWRSRIEETIREWEALIARLEAKAEASRLAENPTSRVCSRCGREKPLAQFPPGRRACRTCLRIKQAEYRQTPEWRKWYEGYRSRPEVRERMATVERERWARIKGLPDPRRSTPMRRAKYALSGAMRRLKEATTPEARERLQGLVLAWASEIARMEAKIHGVDGRTVRHMPTGFTRKRA